ncbi:MAG: TIM barrel protein [Planctomycetaceae bacterium]|jgi:sugar phosphate isomerase/epimerase
MSIRSAVTVSLVSEATGGPFVFWHDLPGAARQARQLGFDAIEIFPPGPEALAHDTLRSLLDHHGLRLAAMGTGAGWVRHQLQLCHPDAARRQQARDFVRRIIDLAGGLGAPAIIGSMQGRWGGELSRADALQWLAEGLEELGRHAAQFSVPLLFEPLNRYETNLVNTVSDGLALVQRLETGNVRLLCDLFHMNIEEIDVAEALRLAGNWVGHVHFVDSNRRPAGCGHLDYRPIVRALRDIGYSGYASAEALPWPDSIGAAAQTMAAFRRWIRPQSE